MKNLFDTAHYPDKEPSELSVGERWAWKREDISSAYPATDYTLKYSLSPLGNGELIRFDAGKSGSSHVVEVASSVTGSYVSDEYRFTAVVVRDSDSEKVEVDAGYISIAAAAGGTDGTSRSWVYEVLLAIRATIKGTATTDQSSFVFGGRELSRRTPAELMDMEKEFSRRWEKEKSDLAKKSGRSTNNRVLMKMRA